MERGQKVDNLSAADRNKCVSESVKMWKWSSENGSNNCEGCPKVCKCVRQSENVKMWKCFFLSSENGSNIFEGCPKMCKCVRLSESVKM